jgi:ATP-dependent protease ClpP protease subunit
MDNRSLFEAPAERPSIERLLYEPNIAINGPIDDSTVHFFLDCLQKVRTDGEDLVMELVTNGGDADAAGRIAAELRIFQRHSGHPAYCVGKSKLYGAGVIIFAAFPRQHRFLTEDAVLFVHERELEKSIELKGPIKSSIQIHRQELALLETAEQLEIAGFDELVAGSSLTADQMYQRALANSYIHADEAFTQGLVAEILR